MKKIRFQNKLDKKKLYYSAYKIMTVLIDILVSIFIVIALCRVLFMFSIVKGDSMSPNVQQGTIVIANRMSYRNQEIQRGDVVMAYHEDKVVIKRVIGLPGDKLYFKNGYVYLNNEVVRETYLEGDAALTYCTEEFDVPEGYYFLMGDNRPESYDSRFYLDPYINTDDIIGKIILQIGTEVKPYFVNMM